MKKIQVVLICLIALNVRAVENLYVNGADHCRWEDRTNPVVLTGQMSSPTADLRINVYEDANRDGKVSGGEVLLRSFVVKGNVGPMGDGRLFPGNIATGGTNNFTIPIFPLVGSDYGSLGLTVEVIDQDGSRATAKVSAPAETPNVRGKAYDTAGEPQLGISVSASGQDPQTGQTFSRSSITDSGGNFAFDAPPGDLQVGGWPYVNSQVQPIENVTLTVPHQGTISPTLEMIPNYLFIYGIIDGPPNQFANLLVSANGTGQYSSALTNVDGFFALGIPQPGEYNIYFGPYAGNENIWPQTYTPISQYFQEYVNQDLSPVHLMIDCVPNNAQVTGAIQVLYNGMSPATAFGYLDLNGFFNVEAYVVDSQTGNELEFFGTTDSMPSMMMPSKESSYMDLDSFGSTDPMDSRPVAGQESADRKVAEDASSPYLDGNAYTLNLRAGQIHFSGIAPFGYMTSSGNSSITAASGEVVQGPTLIWNITSDDVLFIQGIVRYPNGSPAEGAAVAARTEADWNDRSVERMSTTDAEGRYTLPYLQKFDNMGDWARDNHTYHVGVYLSGYTADVQEVLGETSGVHTVNFDLSESSGVSESHALPRTCELKQNYPNPFNPATAVPYSVNRRSHVSLKVYGVDGRLVTTLVDGEHAPGAYKVSWDASNSASGVYLLVMETTDFTHIRKCTLLK